MAVNYVKTYSDMAAEAQRQQRLADLLQQQAEQPIQTSSYQGIQAMPSYAAGLAKILSAYGAERQRRKAEETQQTAKKIGREEFMDYMTALQPTERKLGTALDVAAARPEDQRAAAMLPQNIDMGQVAQSIGAPTAGIAPQGAAPAFQAPQFAVGGAQMSPAQRRAKLLEGMGSDNPMIASVAQAEFAKKPEVEEFGTTPVKGEGGRYYLVSKTGRMVPTDVGVPPEEMTPYQREQLKREDVRLELERQRAASAGALTVGDRFKNENTLRDEYLAQTAPFRTVQDAYSKIKSTSNDGAGDMSLLYSYVKLLDPGSVVRESEFATAAQSGSLGQRVQGAVNQILSGQRLSPDLRESFRKEADKIYQAQKEGATRIGGKYRDLAKSYNLDPSRVVVEYAPPEMPKQDSVFLPQQPGNPFAPQQPAFSAPLPARVGGYYKQ